VLSSRLLGDLIPRVGVSGIYLGGGSGAEWRLKDGIWIVAEEKLEQLNRIRGTVMDEINGLRTVPGADIEDKKWSVAVHIRRVLPGARAKVLAFLGMLQERYDIRLLRGPEVIEVQLLPEIDKLYGVKTLCRLVSLEPRQGLLVYAGDDENDAIAMNWVIRQGGAALSIGRDPLVPGARPVATPASLVTEVRKLAGIKPW
jgi:trehalose 6-phosphate phosphatase